MLKTHDTERTHFSVATAKQGERKILLAVWAFILNTYIQTQILSGEETINFLLQVMIDKIYQVVFRSSEHKGGKMWQEILKNLIYKITICNKCLMLI